MVVVAPDGREAHCDRRVDDVGRVLFRQYTLVICFTRDPRTPRAVKWSSSRTSLGQGMKWRPTARRICGAIADVTQLLRRDRALIKVA